MTATTDQHLDERSTSFEAELRPLRGVAMRPATAMRLERNDAEDAVQEAALRAWRRRQNRRPGTTVRSRAASMSGSTGGPGGATDFEESDRWPTVLHGWRAWRSRQPHSPRC
jgi:Sigma-70 region 2